MRWRWSAAEPLTHGVDPLPGDPAIPYACAVSSGLRPFMNGDVSGRDEVPVEEVAGRLGLPVSMLIRRIDAGVLPGRRIQLDDRVAYLVRADSLDVGAEPVEATVASPAPQSEPHTASVDESSAEPSPHP